MDDGVTLKQTRYHHNIIFTSPDGKEVARFDFDKSPVEFTGDASEAAKIFVNFVKEYWEEALQSAYEAGEKKGRL
jgi:hypothetical protein